MSNSDKNPSEEKEHKPYPVAQPIPKSVRIASWLIILLGLLLFAFGIFVALFLVFIAQYFFGLLTVPVFLVIGWYIYSCGKRMQSGYYSFIYGYSAIGLMWLFASGLTYIKGSSIIFNAFSSGVILMFFIFPIVVAFLNRKRLL